MENRLTIDTVIRHVPRLKDITELAIDNEACVVLRVRTELPDTRLALIAMGCFDGNEIMIRLTKGKRVESTLFYYGGGTHLHVWGDIPGALMPKEKSAALVLDCIEKDYGIKCRQ